MRSIQVLRAAAVVGVVLCHGARFGHGAAGVDLFFVISGFIMAQIAPGRSWREFVAARAWRIFPPYMIALVPWLFIAASIGLLYPAKVAASLTLWPIYGAVFVRPALPAGWSLCYEALFYAGTAAALVYGARRLVAAYIAALLFSLLLPIPLLTFVGNAITLEFLAGVAIARWRPSAPVWLIIPAVVIFATSSPQWSIVIGQSFARVASVGLPAAIVVAVAVHHEARFGRLFDFAVFVGDASYSLYLVHQLVLLPGWREPIGVVLVLIFGVAFHLGVERPLLKLRQARSLLVRAGRA